MSRTNGTRRNGTRPASAPTTMDRALVRQIMAAVTAALEPVATAHGISIRLGRTSFDATSARMVVDAAIVAKGGVAQTREAIAFTRFADIHGFKPSDLGRVFKQNGRTFRIIGLRSSAPKRPILMEDVETGRHFVSTEASVKLALGR